MSVYVTYAEAEKHAGARSFWAALKRALMSLRLLLILSGSLEILAGFLALISPPPVVSLPLRMPVDGIAAVLTRPFGAWCSRWDGLPASSRRRPESCRSGGEYRDHVLQRAGSHGYYLDCSRVGPWRSVVVGSRDCPFGFLRVILIRPRGDETITERSVGRPTGLCV